MRGARLIGCALAVAALFLVTNARADEYTKLTYLTFSGPVALPGITLPGGTYMFKLADPDSGRRVLQVWDKDGMKLYTTLLTIPDERMEASDQPVVLFAERPSGQAQAIKSWFYPEERIGQEFVYPKQQAMAIAKENHASVLSFTDDSVKDNDAAALHSAKIGRLDENGQPVEGKSAQNENRANDNATRNDNAPASQSASTAAAPAAATTAADNDDAASSTTTRAGATTARADADQNNAAAPAPSANRTASAPAVGTTGTAAQSNSTAQSTTAAQSNTAAQSTTASSRNSAPTAVGTSGTTADTQRSNNANSNRANQSDRGANAGAANPKLPRTASPLASIELLSALSLLGGLGVHQLRKRTAEVN